MAKLKFDVALVEKLIDHAATAKEHNPSFAQLMDKQYAKPGAKPDSYGVFEVDDMDLSKVPAGLSLVKDHGIYLISNGLPRLKVSPDSGNRSFVVYAETYGPDADYDRVVAAAGGDDFCEFLPLEMFQTAIAQAKDEGKTHFVVRLTSKHIGIEV